MLPLICRVLLPEDGGVGGLSVNLYGLYRTRESVAGTGQQPGCGVVTARIWALAGCLGLLDLVYCLGWADLMVTQEWVAVDASP